MDGVAHSLKLRRSFIIINVWSFYSVFLLLTTVRAERMIEGGWYQDAEAEDLCPITKDDNNNKNNPSLTHILVAGGTGIDSFTDLHRFFEESKSSPDLMNKFQYVVKKTTTKKHWYEKLKVCEDHNTEVFDSLLNEGAYVFLAGHKEMVTPAEKALKKVAEKKGLELEMVTLVRY